MSAADIGDPPNVPSNGSKSDILNDIPFCDADCERAWKDLRCFGDGPKLCFRPSPDLLLHAWKDIQILASSCDIDLSKPKSAKTSWNMAEQLGRHDFEWPLPLFEAICRPLLTDKCQTKIDTWVPGFFSPVALGCITLSQPATIQWVSKVLLEVHGRMKTEDFRRDLADLLPEKWRNDVAKSTLTFIVCLHLLLESQSPG